MAGSTWRISSARQRAQRVLLCAGLILLPAFPVGATHGFEPGRGPPSDTGPPATADPGDIPATRPEIATDQSRSPPPPESDNWHHNLIRERQVDVRLRTAAKDLEAGQATDALRSLQQILDRDEDVFVRLESEPVPIGAKHLASRLLSGLPPETLKTYETLYGREARRLLDEAQASGQPDRLAAVVRRFFHTAAGFEATRRLAALSMDHGDFEQAAACWQRAVTEPVHRPRVRPIHLLQAAACCERLGNHAAAQRLTGKLIHETVMVAGQSVAVDRWLAGRGPPLAAEDAAAHDTRVVGAGADRNGTSAGTAPAPGRPLWTASLAGKASEHIVALAAAWEKYQLQNGLPVGAAHAPLVVGGQLIFRDFEGIRGVDAATGNLYWSFACESALAREITQRHVAPAAPAEGNPDSNNVMRFLVSHCVLGMLASDGRLVFAVDRLEYDELTQTASTTSNHDQPTPARRQSNALLALEPGAADGRMPVVRWSIGGRIGDDAEPAGVLAGHYFIGPPLPVEDRLYAVSEYRQQLCLSCLSAATGAVAWTQVLCSVPQPVAGDFQRFGLVCSPSCAEGIVVCPTQAGVLVAVDALTGKLLWAASHDDSEPSQRQQMSAWPYHARRRFGHPGYPNLPLISQGRVIYLPAHSESVHCFDLATGRVQWRARRDDLEWSTATEHVAAVAGEMVLVVGRRKCRGLSLATGEERWASRLASSAAGRGVRVGTNYHLPLDDGRIVSLDLERGRQTGVSRTSDHAGLGNLVHGDGVVISMGRAEITAFAQAGPELERVEQRLRENPQSVELTARAAELELALSRPAAAQLRLNSAGRQAGSKSDHVELLREVLLAALANPSDRARTLDELASLAGAPEERAQSLLARLELERDAVPQNLFVAARELSALALPKPVELVGDPSRHVAPYLLAGASLVRWTRDAAAELPAELAAQIDADFAAALKAGDVPAIRRLLAVYDGTPRAGMAMLEFGALLHEQGRGQAAEIAWLAARDSRLPEIAADATRRLAELWSERGLPHSAGLLLDEIRTRFADIEVADGQTGSAWLASYPRERLAWEACRRLEPPAWSGAGARIVERRRTDEKLLATYQGNGIQFLQTPRNSPFELLDKGRTSPGQFAVVDRTTGIEFPETIQVPGRYFYPVTVQTGDIQHAWIGNFVPVSTAAAVHGVSLLERRIVWTTVPEGLQKSGEPIKIGPTGPGFCSCQHRQHLFVLDPVDGRVLWHRDDLEWASGLWGDSFKGIIGDERVLVVFSTNGANYTVYETRTGAELRRGKLDIQPGNRRAFGRRLLHFTASADAKRLRVWDAETDRCVWDEPADLLADASSLEGVPPGSKVYTCVRDAQEMAFVTKTGAIRVVDVPTGETRLELPSDPTRLENSSFRCAFRDGDRYYFNLQRSPPPGAAQPQPGNAVNDAVIPSVEVKGELCVVDRRTHQVLWQRPMGNRTLVHLSEFRLPVLVSLSRVRRGDESSLTLEVIDARTGEVLAAKEDLLSDRLLQVIYDRSPGRIELRGARTEIRVEFPEDLARLTARPVLR